MIYTLPVLARRLPHQRRSHFSLLPALKVFVRVQQSGRHSLICTRVDIFFFSQTWQISSKHCQLKKLFFSRSIRFLCADCSHIRCSLILLNTAVFDRDVLNKFAVNEIDSNVVSYSHWLCWYSTNVFLILFLTFTATLYSFRSLSRAR
jgi:hypothetical protein